MKKACLIVTWATLHGLSLLAGEGTQAAGDVPVFQIVQEGSSINFSVKASVSIEGKFNKWDATLTFASTDVSTGAMDLKIWAASVNTGSGMKDNKLRSKKFFDVKNDPYITFHSSKFAQTGPKSLDIFGTFTIRGVSKPEKLTVTSPDIGKGSGQIDGTMAFDRREFGMNSGIPFIKIADRVEVTVILKGMRVSGPPLDFK